MDWDFEVFRWVQVNLRHPWSDPVVRTLADSGLGQVQLFGLLWAIWVRERPKAQQIGFAVMFFAVAMASTMREFSTYGGLTTGVATLLLIGASRWIEKREAVIALEAGALAGLVRLGVVKLVPRPRPSNYDFVEPLEHLRAATSFPSGHSTTAAAIGVAIALLVWRRNRALALGALSYVFLVGFSRVASGVHYPSDVLAGWALGALFAGISVFMAERRAANQ